ncbi:arginine N-succinyltransferase [Larsenimonas suaedae]|uniref:Arginine N-succinyltransferase n=1 Tax=Larsenimonas suaedae TaxID=1851019 RepID=A0ABU1GUW0_9GAMM|nr:arginine N-succinyltransferase [Larsenimonas suaedae]MCM2972047.1 arginine N-succinyltransferase [Larsenimonas suaedae]MDR5895600.1 arginine N-succinyltransferase [Larsenimonas suaedae]
MVWVVRPAEREDVAKLVALAEQASPRLTNLPPDEQRLSARIKASLEALSSSSITRPGNECYVLVLTDTDTGEVLGTASFRALAGSDEAYYTYRREELIHASQQLDVRVEVPILSLTHELSSSSLLCALALSPGLVGKARTDARLLLRQARLMMAALWPERFASRFAVALPGVLDDDGRSPFWDSIGHHFFDREFQDINTLAGLRSKSFIAEVMPPYPLYLSLLHPRARQSLAMSHETHRDAHAAWQAEGFEDSGHVDIFDGGPVLSAGTERVHVLTHGRWLPVRLTDRPTGAPARMLLANQWPGTYRCALLETYLSAAGYLELTPAQAACLHVGRGQALRVLEDRL